MVESDAPDGRVVDMEFVTRGDGGEVTLGFLFSGDHGLGSGEDAEDFVDDALARGGRFLLEVGERLEEIRLFCHSDQHGLVLLVGDLLNNNLLQLFDIVDLNPLQVRSEGLRKGSSHSTCTRRRTDWAGR